MGMDRLTKAANAAGFAMVNPEDYFGASPIVKVESAPAWNYVSPTTALVVMPRVEAAQSSLRDWWHMLGGGRAPA